MSVAISFHTLRGGRGRSRPGKTARRRVRFPCGAFDYLGAAVALKYLFLHDPSDNVATALDSFEAGAAIPVVTSEGKRVREIELRARVPAYFKVNVSELSDGEPIVKLGSVIGVTVARTLARADGACVSGITPVTIPPGTPIHDTNFIVTGEVWRAWGGFALAFDAITELQLLSRQAPFKFGKAVKNIGAGSDIRLADLEIHEALRRKFFAGLSVAGEMIVGRALTRIPVHSYLRLGCCMEKDYELPIREENVNALAAAYRHSKRLVL